MSFRAFPQTKNGTIYFKGDVVRTKSGETGEIIDTWGKARDWCKIKTDQGKLIFIQTTEIESIISRQQDKKRKWK